MLCYPNMVILVISVFNEFKSMFLNLKMLNLRLSAIFSRVKAILDCSVPIGILVIIKSQNAGFNYGYFGG